MGDFLAVKGFYVDLEIVNADGTIASRSRETNKIPDDSLAFLMQAPFGDVSAVSTFYCGLFRGNYIPSGATAAADIPSNMIEFVDYSESVRPTWQRAFDNAATMDNVLNRASYTVTQDRTLYGSFIVSDSTKGGNTGLLLSCCRFSTAKQVSAGQTINLQTGLTYVPTSAL